MSMDSDFFLGIDVGSETAKIAVVNKDCNIIEKLYLKHFGKPAEIVSHILKDIVSKYKNLKICFTGVSGRFIAKTAGAPYVNEIVSQATATSFFYPQVRTIIEIGGEDSKLIFLDKGGRIKDFSLNSICAAGTGSFLEQQAERLGLTIEEFSELATKSDKPSKIAGRCSVFAKSDMIHLQQIATPVEDIIAGLCFALARNFKATMFKGRTVEQVVAFQGGVAANKGMVKAFKKILNIDEILIPEHFEVTGAIGAAIKAQHSSVYLNEKIIDKLSSIKAEIEYGLPPLKKERFLAHPAVVQNGKNDSCQSSASSLQSDSAYLGIDVGSVSTNIVLIDEDGKLIAKKYLPTAGRPIDAVKRGFNELNEEFPKIKIKGAGVTGSGRYMIADFVGADIIKNEITAHAHGAVHYDSSIDTIFEIGGQDSKYIRLKDGKVVDFEMNKACAAGTGSFIEEQADKLGVSLEEFQRLAFASETPCRLGERCTVFMENSLVINLHKGARKEDIVAGLCYSIVENYINRVVAGKPIGKKIFFQGGVAFNKAVIAAFENFLKSKIDKECELIIPINHEVMGAIGVALLAKDFMKNGKKSKFKGFSLRNKQYTISSFECKGCPNYCEINRVKLEGEEKNLFYGGRCEKYEKQDFLSKLPDPVKLREELLWKTHKEYEKQYKDRKAPVIGIPYIFFFHDHLPFWSTLLWELGFNVRISDKTNKKIINKGVEKVLSEACFPLKVAYGHIADLVEKGIDLIFVPSFINLNLYDEYERGLACPLVQTIPYVSRKLFNEAKILIPRIDFSRGFDYLKKELFRTFKGIINIKNIDAKISIAREKQKEFVNSLQKEGLKLLETAKDKSLGQQATVVIIGRSYNSFDQAVSLDISGKLTRLDVLPIPMDMLPLDSVNIKDEWNNLYWRSGQRIIRASKFLHKLDEVYPLFITNFSCGPDSFIINYFKEEMLQKPYLILEIDEHSADAGIVTRLEAFIDSVKSREEKRSEQIFIPLSIKTSNKDLSKRTIYIPRMSDHAFALKAAFNYCGIDAEVMPPSDKESIELARKYIGGGECFPYVVTLGDMLKLVFSRDFNPEKTAFFMPSGAGPCRFGQYNVSHRRMLKKLGFDNVPVYSPQQDAQFYKDLNIAGSEFSLRAWQGIVAYGLLIKILLQTRPYEKNKGETESLYEYYLTKICDALKSRNGNIENLMNNMKKDFENIPKYKDKKPLVGIVGEIFVRSHSFSNENLIKRLESLGAEVYFTPIEEWIHYVNKMALRKALIKKDKSAIIKILINKFFQWRVEKKFSSNFKETLKFLHEPSIKELFKFASPYVPDSFEGETILSIGKSVDLIKKGVSGIINAMPFGCMPGAIVTALLRFIQRDYNIPVVSLAFDGTNSTVNELWLEAFIETIKT
ncbi:(R)-2-hydroxyglutaryl-CoA dehydratase activator-related protein [Thermodesulfovibrio yellowstonii DSM 11347]|uniref:(R)-2-hydroxyglutaryl-CoA dehydratase activator-related protein n=2 Tax=Thermodesulfovibrio yellowstonii TaxID=28262 RepID=B5YJ20_THEYD|nr:(R)-2-hydroxyglutaryl-CoA dehydratase activator-related protein [Thermodesulfovibrio yellowstonii DSM 11347]